MKIEIWSDFVCPFCYIGKRRLEAAIANLPYHDKIFIEFKSYELDPYADQTNEQNFHESLATKYRVSIKKARKMTEDVRKQAIEEGLKYNFETIQPAKTFDAHRLIKYAAKHHKEYELTERLFKAYFTNSDNISDHAILIKLAYEVGLNRDETDLILQTCKYTKSVRFDQDQAKEMGIQAVPFFVFNEKYAISGAQPTSVFSDVITKIWNEECQQHTNEFQQKKPKTTYCCEDDECLSTDENVTP